MICAPVREKNIKKVIESIKRSQKEVDLVELWFDEIENLNEELLEKIFSLKKRPFLYKALSDDKKIAEVLRFNVEFIDVDVSYSQEKIKKIKKLFPKTKIVISFHDFDKTPEINFLRRIILKMQKNGADIIKIATKANSIKDSFMMLELLSELNDQKIKAICLCMGKEGMLTRTSGHLFKNYIMYAPLNTKNKTAEGQLTVKEFKKILN
jgi:3-dehydroquinate dehydratase-1